MNNIIKTPVADLADRMLQLVALSMFAVSLMFALSVIEFFVNDNMARYLDIGAKVLAVSIILLMAVVFFWKFRNTSREERREYLDEDGFLQTSFQRAMAKSWMISFAVLAILQVFDNLLLERLPEMPLELVFKSIVAFMLATFSVAFFVFTRTSSNDDLRGENE